MDFQLTAEEEAFRGEVREFLDEHLPPADQRGGDFMKNWFKHVREKRWVGFSWPEDVGGGGGSIMELVILKDLKHSILIEAPDRVLGPVRDFLLRYRDS